MTGDGNAAARYLENWQDEVDSAAEYRAMAAAEPDPRLAKVYANLGAMEEAHVAFWEKRLRDAGASVDGHGLLVTGVAGLVAGACSMALGEWVSVTSSRDLAQREIRIETGELTEDPEGEGDELKLIYEARGLSPGEADTMVKHLLADRSSAIDALAREELGIDPTQLGGSAWEAALTSFVLFAIGALVPILPFLVARGNLALAASAVVSALGLFGIGAAITIFTGAPVWRSGGRQLLLGLAAAGVTFGLGRLIGMAITG